MGRLSWVRGGKGDLGRAIVNVTERSFPRRFCSQVLLRGEAFR